MPKKRLRVHFRLPKYVASPPDAWRQQIHAAAEQAFDDAHVAIARSDRIQLEMILYLDRKLETHDVDNRLKDVMDALQGLVQGRGEKRRDRSRLLPSDSQVFRVVVEKRPPPKNSHGLGHVTVRRYKPGG